MENYIRLDAVKNKLKKLKGKDMKFRVPGAGKHHYESFIFDEKAILEFEKLISCTLPDEYREFVKYIGFGAGPGNGILNINESRAIFKRWEDDLGRKADISGHFQYTTSISEQIISLRRNGQLFDKKRLLKVDGIFPICHYGGTHYVYIVVGGEEEGKVWSLNTERFETLPIGNDRGMYFLDWYENWLDNNLEQSEQESLDTFYVGYLNKIFPYKQDEDFYRKTKLFFDRDNFSQFSEIDEDYRQIEWISLADCQLNNLPDKMFAIKGLKGVDFEMNNISGIYSSFKNMKELKYISLSHNNLKAIPEPLKHLKELKILDASYNYIESVPDFIGELEELEYINLSNNRIREIHSSISRLGKLRKLDLSYNKGLFGLNSLINVTGLELLDLSGCGLLVFPYYVTMMKRLKRLYLSGNSFNKIPPEIKMMQSLTVLILNENVSENLEETISIVAQLKNLKELFIPYQDIFKIPQDISLLKNISKITFYPALPNRGKFGDHELVESFLEGLKSTLSNTKVDLIY